jgi:asparagine synthase (glutamine-hydrolysing)
MCGIAGWLGHLADGAHRAQDMARLLRHRGPDDCASLAFPDAGLVHTRLSIIDLSESGRQPMANEDSTTWIVFNGEIYNHRELRRDLERRGHRFRGHSDSEIVPHLYEEEGRGFLHRLRGMFAIAIYDSKTRTLLLARDRFGIKPLFYAAGDSRVAFASEINALLGLPGIDVQPDRQSVFDFAALLYIPAPQTFYRGIRALEPGEWLEARLGSDGRVSTATGIYHQWRIGVEAHANAEEVVTRGEHLVQQAVSRQLESDVPLGSLLSGGIDSSLVSCAAQTELHGSLKTFNVRFPEEEYDETWAAAAVAQHIGSDHETLDIGSTPGTWEHITDLLLHAGQPFADTSLFAVDAVCGLMRQRVAVALSGDGGDEGFGGYDSYWRIARILRYQRLPRAASRAVDAFLGPLSYCGVVSERVVARMQELKDADDTSIVQTLSCWLRSDEHSALCRDSDMLPIRRWFVPLWDHQLPRRSSRLERLSAQMTEVFTRLTMANDFLSKVDTASMRHSLEVRVPMLDEDLFSFGLSLPHSYKVRGRRCKRVLRSVAERWLPPKVAHKPKLGFGIPLDTWVNGQFKERFRETVLASSTPLDEFFRPSVYRPIVQAFCDDQPLPGTSRQGLYQRAIMLLSLHLHLGRAASLSGNRTARDNRSTPVTGISILRCELNA